MLGVLAGRLVGSDDPASTTTPVHAASDPMAGAMPVNLHPAAVDAVQLGSLPTLERFATLIASPHCSCGRDAGRGIHRPLRRLDPGDPDRPATSLERAARGIPSASHPA